MSSSALTSSTTSSATSAATGPGESAPAIFIHPATAVCMKTHVPFTLEINSNYPKWSSYFKVLCGKFGLRPHIDAPGTPNPDDPHWVITDSCVKSWLFGSIGDSVLDLAMAGNDQNACQLWSAIEELFTANQELRAILLLE